MEKYLIQIVHLIQFPETGHELDGVFLDISCYCSLRGGSVVQLWVGGIWICIHPA